VNISESGTVDIQAQNNGENDSGTRRDILNRTYGTTVLVLVQHGIGFAKWEFITKV
jgi:hypothetical protein